MNGTADFAAPMSPWRQAARLAAITFAVFSTMPNS